MTSVRHQTRYFTPLYEVVDEDGIQKHIHYLSAPTGIFAIFTVDNKNQGSMKYVLKDHLASLAALVAFKDSTGFFSFDVWGRRRDPNTWQIISNFSQPLLFDRGFTGHEHLTEFNLINMNGRIYDPTIMRFLSPDPIIQAPDFSQSFNRYSYVMNNPMNLLDRSGFYWEDYEDDPPHVTDAEFREQNKDGFWLPEVEVKDSKINPMEEIWKMHDGFEFDREYDGYDAENNRAAGQGGNNPIEYVGAVNDIALATAMGYNALDNGLKRKYAYQLSKHINAKPGNIYQSAKSFGRNSAKVLGKTANVVAVGSIAYDFGSGTANTATLLDAGMLIGGGAAVFFIGATAAPVVVGAGIVYGVGCLFGFDDYLNETFDRSKSINFNNK